MGNNENSDMSILVVRRHPAISRGYDKGAKGLRVGDRILIDLTSSDYEWYKHTSSYSMLKIENVKKYIDDILSYVDMKNIILVISSHEIVAQMLDAHGIDYLSVFPNKELYSDFIKNLRKREDRRSDEFRYVENHWFPFVTEIKEDSKFKSHIELYDASLTLIEVLNDYLNMTD